MLSRVVLRSLVQRPIPASQLAGCTLLFNKSFSSKKDKKEAPKPPSNTPAPTQVNASSQSKTSFPNAESLLDELKEAILKKKTNSYSTFFASKLFEFAKQNNQTDKLITEFEQLLKNIEQNPEIANLVKYSTVIPKEQYISLQNLLKEKKTPDYFLSIIASLYKLHKLRILSKILDTIRVYQDQALGIIRGELLSAEEFSPKKLNQLIEEIKEQVDAKQVILKTRVDSNLISGFVLNTPLLKVDTSESGLIASALAEKLNREEQQLRKLTRAWESGFANYVAPKPDEAHKLVNVPETADVFDTPIKNRKNVYDFYGLLQRNPDAQEEYRSFAPVDDPDLFLRDAFEQLRYRQEGKKIYAENQARRAYFESLQWDPEIPDDLTVPYFTEIKANK